MAKSTRSRSRSRPSAQQRKPRLYTLDVFLIRGPVTSRFVKKNRVVQRTIQMRGDQTLQELHRVILRAFDREEEHHYEFQFGGKGPMDPKATRYVVPGALAGHRDGSPAPAGAVTDTTLDSLRLRVGTRFGYCFDFGDDWWHQINVEDIGEVPGKARYPKIVKRVGASPPQYADLDEDEEKPPKDGTPTISTSAAADVACLVAEGHLQRGEYGKAVSAFTRAIENRPSTDAYQGRARAYRALAEADDRAAEGIG